MAREGINKRIFDSAVFAPPDWAADFGVNAEGKTINFLPAQKAVIDAFLSATTDSVRLVAASAASRAILAQCDMEELEELREHIQLSELLRAIPYGRQTDHSAHTLYLFLLGMYFFFHSPRIRKAFAKTIGKKGDAPETLDRFNLQWTFASLLHDVGYIFQSDTARQRAVDRMFRAPTIVRRIPPQETKNVLLQVRETILGTALPGYTTPTDPEDQLDRLRKLPWGKDVGLHCDAFTTFFLYGPQGGTVDAVALEDFAYLVAATGYDGISSGVVDHAVASGLFLLAYSTFWYWLARQVNYQGVFGVYRDSYFVNDIVCACFAVAAHNMIGAHAKQFGKLKFDDNPLLYLGILCDELQKWDRYPAGDEFLANLKSFAEHCTDSENLHLTQKRGRFVFTFESEELAKKIKKGLDRLEAWEDLVEVRTK